MTVKRFIIDICGIFLSMTLTETIQNIITDFSIFALLSSILIFFLSLNFFFAKFKQLQEGDDNISAFGFVINILTLMCFAAMPFFLTSLVGLMATQIFLRISDMFLILYNNNWSFHINVLERRWMIFDIVYFIIIVIFIVLGIIFKNQTLDIILVTAYLLMGIFESVFDFYVNKESYGMVASQSPAQTQNEEETQLDEAQAS
ncbi:MAG: hypothetical protein E7360_05070 [Clostridiales bacterium]|nr:hypothetical protein [Clostridiales bacterium]